VKRRLVLDAWAMLAFIQGEEPAASRVKQLLEDAREGLLELFICIINLPGTKGQHHAVLAFPFVPTLGPT
jgi:hypothetical protein